MTDINEPLTGVAEERHPDAALSRKSARRPDAELLAFAELLFFAYRDFTRDPDAILKDFDFGRAHHRVLHFVNRHSGLRVADLLDALKITKQSLGRVLKQLIDKGYIVQQAGSIDRRERLLYPTEAGRALAIRLAAPQLVRLAEALRAAGPTADAVVRGFLQAMINAEERPKVSSIMASLPAAADDSGNAEVS
ncbi:MAG: MarR family transcriptional regulator [Methyloceanibacter sp.]